jgi:hypothetical protein
MGLKLGSSQAGREIVDRVNWNWDWAPLRVSPDARKTQSMTVELNNFTMVGLEKLRSAEQANRSSRDKIGLKFDEP